MLCFIILLLLLLCYVHAPLLLQLYYSIIYDRHLPVAIVLPLATKSLMLEFCFTHPDSIRMLFPGGDNVTIQSTSGSQEREKKGHRGKRDGNRDIEMDRWCFHSQNEEVCCVHFFFFSPHFTFFLPFLPPHPSNTYQVSRGARTAYSTVFQYSPLFFHRS